MHSNANKYIRQILRILGPKNFDPPSFIGLKGERDGGGVSEREREMVIYLCRTTPSQPIGGRSLTLESCCY